MDNNTETITRLQQFRQDLYILLPRRRDALFNLLDALCSSPNARSVVELSLNPLFERTYSSLTDAIDNLFQASSSEQARTERWAWQQQLTRLIGRYLPPPTQRPFWLLVTDVVPLPRPFSATLADRSYVYQPNLVGSHPPVTIGQRASLVAYLPERATPTAPRWVVPLHFYRVPSSEKATVVAAEQLDALLTDPELPFQQQLCVSVLDSAYSAVTYLGRLTAHKNLVTVVRAPNNRVFYRQPPPTAPSPPAGHPRWYGPALRLAAPAEREPPDEVVTTTWRSRTGTTYQVELRAWRDLLMRGQHDLPMHTQPFTLVEVVIRDAQGKRLFKRPLWLLIYGPRRTELALVQAWEVYGKRYDVEHYFRFGKQRLLLGHYQTPEVEHSENWLHIVQLATTQLWLGRTLAGAQVRPWERYLPQRAGAEASPSQVQRDWLAIIRQIGTPAQAPKRRGNAPGRGKGTSPGRRPRPDVVKKPARTPKTAAATP